MMLVSEMVVRDFSIIRSSCGGILFCSCCRVAMESCNPDTVEVAGVVAVTHVDGTVVLSSAKKTVTFQSGEMAQLCGISEGTQGVQTGTASAAAPPQGGGSDGAAPQVWRERLVTLADSVIHDFHERGDVDLEDCPILDEVVDLRAALSTDASLTEDDAVSVLRTARLFLAMCEDDF